MYHRVLVWFDHKINIIWKKFSTCHIHIDQYKVQSNVEISFRHSSTVLWLRTPFEAIQNDTGRDSVWACERIDTSEQVSYMWWLLLHSSSKALWRFQRLKSWSLSSIIVNHCKVLTELPRRYDGFAFLRGFHWHTTHIRNKCKKDPLIPIQASNSNQLERVVHILRGDWNAAKPYSWGEPHELTSKNLPNIP